MSSHKKILLLECDPIQAQHIVEEIIWANFPDAEVRYFDSEYSLLQAIAEPEMRDWNPEYAISHLLVRYYSPDDWARLQQPPLPDNLPEPNRGGFRCLDAIRNAFPGIKVAMVTLSDVTSDHFPVFQKGSDSLAEELTSFLRS